MAVIIKLTKGPKIKSNKSQNDMYDPNAYTLKTAVTQYNVKLFKFWDIFCMKKTVKMRVLPSISKGHEGILSSK